MLKYEAQFQFGEKLRLVRERKGLTLKEVAHEANVSESLVSQIERNKVSPSIDTLLQIADCLDIDFEYLFKDFKKTKKVELVRAAERHKIVLKDVTYHQLSRFDNPSDAHNIEAVLIEIEPGREKGSLEYGHPGKELGLILKGEGELLYGTESYRLYQGDCVSFLSDIPHILKNTGRESLQAVWIITPPKLLSNLT